VIGQGTTLTLSLPLSMAVNKVMMIDVAGQQFGLPMEVVVETVRVPIEDIHHIQNQLAIVLRGKITPLLSLHGLLGVTEQPVANSENELAVLVCRVGQDTLGVIVDGFDSTIDILLRPLDGVLANMHQYAGSALLGDGTVLLILNLTEMMSCQ
jgi:two-component system chemotaxis sensor kinase CheA